MSTAFDTFLLEVESLKALSSSILLPFINSRLVLENEFEDLKVDEESWVKKVEKLVSLEQQIYEYQIRRTLENIEETLDTLQDQINQTLQIYSPILKYKK
ncbi:uncharacterized protein T551_02851 [Pneumocystis jirovecii RU7]|uniref:Uncharacterized protein n=1 Tax=Pneumocystis jirovecii (strain RU7) TaxID=1408657 RepID=A0A0W4ZHP5_PNEJ7|nr:uncharacterized protein T551_02851 [Pneumocystis jirovecii RU7]KTW27884.1 hypothetical protein T551_02851 [Pneumocystis jirovecii RU7]